MSFKEKSKDIIQSIDGIEFPFDMKAMTKVSQIFNKMVQHVNLEENDELEENNIIPLPISSFNLQLILKWINYYYKEPVGDLIDIKLESESCIFISKWDFEFIKELTVDQIINLENASQFLELESLIRLCQRRLCVNLLFSTQNKIRKRMNVSNDYTTEEEHAVRKENEWYEDLEGIKF